VCDHDDPNVAERPPEAPPAADPEVHRRLLDGAPLVVATVDAAGRITWVSAATEWLFGYTAAELVGTNMLDHVDLDWNPAALDSVAAALSGSGLQRPMTYRLRRKDGSFVVAEVTANSQLDDPHIDGLAIYIRRWDERYLIDRVVDSLAGGVTLDEVLELLVGVMGAENLDADGVVMLDLGHRGFARSVAGPGLAPQQVHDSGRRDTPWHRARTTGEPVAVRVADLPDELRSALAPPAGDDGSTTGRGHRSCWAWPVPGPEGVDACLVLWRRDDEEPDHTCRFLLDRLVRLTALVLQRERSAASLRRAANFDELTGLANRANFFGELQDALDRPADDTLVGVLYVDLDGFKPVNDRLGHGAGDQVLREVARRLRTAVRSGDLVARLGGDEFTVLCRSIADLDVLQHIAERITGVMARPVGVGSETVVIGASIGIAASPPGACSIDVLVDAADAALYQVKAADKGGFRFSELDLPTSPTSRTSPPSPHPSNR